MESQPTPLWPKTTVDSAAVRNLFPPQVLKPQESQALLQTQPSELSQNRRLPLHGQFLLDEDFLRSEGVEDFSEYAVNPELGRLQPDLYVD